MLLLAQYYFYFQFLFNLKKSFITIGILAVKTFLHFTITHKLFAKITHLVSGS